MSTSSIIAVLHPNGTVESVYCHSDGYPSFNGVKLIEHFGSYDAATELISGGDISCLWTSLSWDIETLPEPGPRYYSSRGENTPYVTHKDPNHFWSSRCGYSYVYLHDGHKWILVDDVIDNSVKGVSIGLI